MHHLTSPEGPTIAPRWHTGVLIGLVVSVALTGTLLGGRIDSSASAASSDRPSPLEYLPIFAVQAGLLVYVARLGRPRWELRLLLGRRWTTARRAFIDLVLALLGWGLIQGIEALWTRLEGGASAPISTILPHTPAERVAWVALAALIGLSEEVVYRGYLRIQLTVFTGRPIVAIVLQAFLFGLAHADQGLGAMARISLYGLGFGLLARYRQSLWPCIVCHVTTDALSGLLSH